MRVSAIGLSYPGRSFAVAERKSFEISRAETVRQKKIVVEELACSSMRRAKVGEELAASRLPCRRFALGVKRIE